MLENAQAMAPRTTKLHDRTGDEITLDEVERITIGDQISIQPASSSQNDDVGKAGEKKRADVSDRGKSSPWPSGG
jgi:hypothetical protein